MQSSSFSRDFKISLYDSIAGLLGVAPPCVGAEWNGVLLCYRSAHQNPQDATISATSISTQSPRSTRPTKLYHLRDFIQCFRYSLFEWSNPCLPLPDTLVYPFDLDEAGLPYLCALTYYHGFSIHRAILTHVVVGSAPVSGVMFSESEAVLLEIDEYDEPNCFFSLEDMVKLKPNGEEEELDVVEAAICRHIAEANLLGITAQEIREEDEPIDYGFVEEERCLKDGSFEAPPPYRMSRSSRSSFGVRSDVSSPLFHSFSKRRDIWKTYERGVLVLERRRKAGPKFRLDNRLPIYKPLALSPMRAQQAEVTSLIGALRI